jgi:isopentenyl phosphate kinase
MLIFIKLGGSLLTDKNREASFRESVAHRLAKELKASLVAQPDLRLLVGHGSGSFGHFAAERYRTIEGVRTTEEWRGFAHVATVAAELNNLVAKTLDAAGIAVWRFQPSASALSRDGRLVQMAVQPIRQALEHGLTPLVYGDVSLDSVRGGTIISTETIFFYLAQHLPVNQILLLGEVAGVYDQSGRVISEITSDNFTSIAHALGGSGGTDVTGGMASKVREMLALTETLPQLTIRIMDGLQPNLLRNTLLSRKQPGTLIHNPQ